MKKKGLAAIGLVGIMAMTMCMPVFAASDLELTESTTTVSSEVKYSKSAAYTIKIPAETALSSAASESNVSITGSGAIGENQALNVSVALTGGKIILSKQNGSWEIPVSISEGTNTPGGTDTSFKVATFAPDTDGTGLTLTSNVVKMTADKALVGEYTTSLTYTVSIAP